MYRKGLRFCWVKYRYASRKCKIIFFFFFNPPYLWAVHDRMQLPVRRTTTGNGRGEFYRMAIDGSYWIVSRNRWFKHTATFSLLLSTIYGCENMREKLFFSFFYSHREDKGYNISTPFFFERGLSRSIIRVVTGSFAPLTNPHTTSPKKMTSCLVSSRPSADDFTFVCNSFERVPLDFRNEFSGPFFVSL